MSRYYPNKPVTIHSTVHNGIEIVYDMQRDQWVFTLHGRDRHAKSLGEAIKLIEKPAPKHGEFKRVECMVAAGSWGREDSFERVVVTSIADDKYSNDVWTVTVRGKVRSKRREDACYLITPNNMKLMDQIKKLSTEIVKLEKMKNRLYDQLHKLHVERESE